MALRRPSYYDETIATLRDRCPLPMQAEIGRRRCFGWLYYDRDEQTGDPLPSPCSRDGVKADLCPARERCKAVYLVAEERERLRQKGRDVPSILDLARLVADAGGELPLPGGRKSMHVLENKAFDLLREVLSALGNPAVARGYWRWDRRFLLGVMQQCGPIVLVAPRSYHTLIAWVPTGPQVGEYRKVARFWTDWYRRLRVELVGELEAALRAETPQRLWLDAMPDGSKQKFPGATARAWLHYRDEARHLAEVILRVYGYDRETIATWGQVQRGEVVAEE